MTILHRQGPDIPCIYLGYVGLICILITEFFSLFALFGYCSISVSQKDVFLLSIWDKSNYEFFEGPDKFENYYYFKLVLDA